MERIEETTAIPNLNDPFEVIDYEKEVAALTSQEILHSSLSTSACSENNGNCDQICHDTPAGAICSCRPGYQLDSPSGTKCNDIDECQLKTHCCAQKCVNNEGSFECSCNAGFRLSLDGCSCLGNKRILSFILIQCDHLFTSVYPSINQYYFTPPTLFPCLDIDECEENNQCDHICINSAGSFRCACELGFKLSNGDLKTCIQDPSLVITNWTAPKIHSETIVFVESAESLTMDQSIFDCPKVPEKNEIDIYKLFCVFFIFDRAFSESIVHSSVTIVNTTLLVTHAVEHVSALLVPGVKIATTVVLKVGR